MNRFFLAVAFVLVAGAPSIWARPVPCSTKAKPLIDVDHRYNNLPDGVGWVFQLLDSGSWTLFEPPGRSSGAVDHVRKPSPLVEVGHGCFDAAALNGLKSMLARATWKSTHRDPCTAMNPVDAQSYAVRGKHVWVSRQCSSAQLDTASANAVDAIDALLEAARSANKKQP